MDAQGFGEWKSHRVTKLSLLPPEKPVPGFLELGHAWQEPGHSSREGPSASCTKATRG